MEKIKQNLTLKYYIIAGVAIASAKFINPVYIHLKELILSYMRSK